DPVHAASRRDIRRRGVHRRCDPHRIAAERDPPSPRPQLPPPRPRGRRDRDRGPRGHRSHPGDQPAPVDVMGVKITITFSDPTDPEAFERHYVGTHAPLVRKLPGLRAYEYGRALTNFDGSPPDAFWVVSLTFDDAEAMHAS